MSDEAMLSCVTPQARDLLTCVFFFLSFYNRTRIIFWCLLVYTKLIFANGSDDRRRWGWGWLWQQNSMILEGTDMSLRGLEEHVKFAGFPVILEAFKWRWGREKGSHPMSLYIWLLSAYLRFVHTIWSLFHFNPQLLHTLPHSITLIFITQHRFCAFCICLFYSFIRFD